MNAPTSAVSDPVPVTSLPAKLANILVSPGYVFDEIAGSPPRLANWLVPTVLACLASLLLLSATAGRDEVAERIRNLKVEETLSSGQAEVVARNWPATSAAATCVGVCLGTLCSASILWLMGRCVLRSPFPFVKSIEVVGLAGMVLALGALVNFALIGATGDAAARPALSLLFSQLPAEGTFRSLLEALDFFNLWTTTVLAIGLSRLSKVSLREAAFWVFGYWVVVRVSLILLA